MTSGNPPAHELPNPSAHRASLVFSGKPIETKARKARQSEAGMDIIEYHIILSIQSIQTVYGYGYQTRATALPLTRKLDILHWLDIVHTKMTL